jgi:hypothetical protein
MGIEEMTDEEKDQKDQKERTWTIVGFTTFGLMILAHATGTVEPFGVFDWLTGALLITSMFKTC